MTGATSAGGSGRSDHWLPWLVILVAAVAVGWFFSVVTATQTARYERWLARRRDHVMPER